MKLTRAADYAVRIMIYMAGLSAGTRVNRSELASATGCPEQFLSKILQQLARAKLIRSHRGNTGGFELPQDSGATVLKVIEAVEGPVCLNFCLASDRSCDRQGWCPGHTVWAKAQRAMAAVLGNALIAELAQQAAQTLESRPQALVATPQRS
jgi:Rrf2 family transcriptional regulator, iron-sulfur cluster assembly transcription factor